MARPTVVTTLEHAIATRYWKDSAQLCFFEVLEALRFVDGDIAAHPAEQSVPTAWHFSLLPAWVEANMESLCVPICVSTGSPKGCNQTLHSILHGWRRKYPGNKLLRQPHIAAQLPAPFALLCVRGAWPVFAAPLAPVRSQAFTRLFGGGSDFVRGSDLTDNANLRESTCLEPEQLEHLAQHLAKWSPSILSGSVAREIDEIKLCGFIDMLNSLATNLYKGSSDIAKAKNRGFRGFRFKGAFLLKAFFLARLMHSSKELQEVVKRSISLVVPEPIARGVLESLQDDSVFPSQPTMSRQAMRIDGAYMNYMKEWFRSNMPHMVGYLLIDASEVGGRDWEIAELFLVPRDQLDAISDAMDLLMTASPERRKDSDCMEASAFLLKCGHRHVFPIASMGARHSDIAHTLSTNLHQMRLVISNGVA